MPGPAWVTARKQVKLWMLEAEYNQLKRDCADAGLSMADYIRELIAAHRRAPSPVPPAWTSSPTL